MSGQVNTSFNDSVSCNTPNLLNNGTFGATGSTAFSDTLDLLKEGQGSCVAQRAGR